MVRQGSRKAKETKAPEKLSFKKRRRLQEKHDHKQWRKLNREEKDEDDFWEEHLGEGKQHAVAVSIEKKTKRNAWKALPTGVCSIHKVERETCHLRPVGPVRLKCKLGFECDLPQKKPPTEADYGMCCTHNRRRRLSELRPKGDQLQCRPGQWCHGTDDDW
eukprot:GGOE01000831.1.p1 GENE.GGOE01000831.1~~GGOE01000831.1.p1  ORF type:complete len:161 (-),score=36.93 GGOE01000831.1:232-714(-)